MSLDEWLVFSQRGERDYSFLLKWYEVFGNKVELLSVKGTFFIIKLDSLWVLKPQQQLNFSSVSVSHRYYSATILQMSGVRDDRLAIWLAGLTTLTNFLFTLLGVWLVERVGRRKLTLGSIIGTVLTETRRSQTQKISTDTNVPVSFLLQERV